MQKDIYTTVGIQLKYKQLANLPSINHILRKTSACTRGLELGLGDERNTLFNKF